MNLEKNLGEPSKKDIIDARAKAIQEDPSLDVHGDVPAIDKEMLAANEAERAKTPEEKLRNQGLI